MLACRKGYIELVKDILERDELVDTKDKDGRTALLHAIYQREENQDVVRELINKNADVNV